MGTEILLRATGGTTCPAPMTAAAAAALESAGSLLTGCPYIVTDWTTTGLAGPNLVVLTAASASAFSTEVKISTPLGYAGPCRGLYVVAANLMIEIGDTLGNTLNDVTGAFPWGNGSWTNNTITSATLIGAAGAFLGGVSRCTLNGGTYDFTGVVTAAGLIRSTIRGGSIALGPQMYISDCDFDETTITNTCTATVQITSTTIIGTSNSLTLAGTADTNIYSCEMVGGVGIAPFVDTTGATRKLTIADCQLIRSHIVYSRTGGADEDFIGGLHMSTSTLTITGANNPGSEQTYNQSEITSGSTVTATNPATVNPLGNTVVEAESTLNIQAGGAVTNCRISTGATVNTGAFAHTATVIEFAGTTTLTAGNTAKYKGFGASNVT